MNTKLTRHTQVLISPQGDKHILNAKYKVDRQKHVSKIGNRNFYKPNISNR